MIGNNSYTNTLIYQGLYSYLVTNAAITSNFTSANVLPSLGAFAVAGQQTATFQTSMLFRKGISCLPSTNVNVIIFYDPL